MLKDAKRNSICWRSSWEWNDEVSGGLLKFLHVYEQIHLVINIATSFFVQKSIKSWGVPIGCFLYPMLRYMVGHQRCQNGEKVSFLWISV